jgi:hypothetical protein
MFSQITVEQNTQLHGQCLAAINYAITALMNETGLSQQQCHSLLSQSITQSTALISRSNNSQPVINEQESHFISNLFA